VRGSVFEADLGVDMGCRFGVRKGRFAHKNRRKSIKINTVFEVIVLMIKELSAICTENRAAFFSLFNFS
jgi:hypothetical protein